MNKLRIAFVTENTLLEWQHSVIYELNKIESIDFVLNINVARENNKPSPLLWKQYLKIDSKLFSPKPYALKKIKSHNLFDNIPHLEYDNIVTKELETYKLDVIINLTEVNLSKDIINLPQYGLWFLSLCDLNTINKKPYGIWELLNKMPENVGILRYIDKNNIYPKTISQTSSCTDNLSYKRNINSILWQSHRLIIDNIKLLAKDEKLFQKRLIKNEKEYVKKAIEVPLLPPSNFKILSYGLSLFYKKVLQLIKSKFYFDQWALIFLDDASDSQYKLNKYTKILPPKDRFWADPFLLKRNGKHYLFIEELIYKNKLGHLSVMEIDESGKYTKPEPILIKDYHLSYPFIFEENNELYMIPETSGNHNIQLYKCVDFPLKWKLEKVLMEDVIAVDTTLFKDDNTFWMFTNIKSHEGVSKNVELNIFYSKSLISNNWTPHPLNPVVTDVKTARPAGSIFSKDGKLYRPSQNCSKYYGYGLNIIEITKLNESEYEEKMNLKIEPNWEKNVHSVHTFNNIDNLYISDVKLRRSRF